MKQRENMKPKQYKVTATFLGHNVLQLQ